MAKIAKKRVISRKTIRRVERDRIQTRNLKIVAFIVGIMIVGVIAFGLVDQLVFQKNKPVATVDNQSIPLKDFTQRVRFERWQLIQEYISTSNMFGGNQELSDYLLDQLTAQLDDPVVLGERVLDTMVDEVVIEQEADKLGIQLTEDELETQIRAAFGYFPDGTFTPSPTMEIYPTSTYSAAQLALVTMTPTSTPEEVVEDGPDILPEDEDSEPENVEPIATATPYSLDGFQENYDMNLDRLKEVGLSDANFRDIFRAYLLRQKVYDSVTSDGETETEKVWARHILVQSEEEALVVLGRLEDGEDWSDIAAETSQDTSNNERGGDLGWFDRGVMDENFEKAAFDLDVGEVSDPVESSFGFHIIQVLGHEMRPLSATEYQTAQQQAFNEWLEDAKSDREIEKFEDVWQDEVPTEPDLTSALLPY